MDKSARFIRKVLVVTISICIVTVSGGTPIDERDRILNETLARSNPRIAPITKKGDPVVNLVQMYILSIDSVSDVNMDYKMNFYLRQSWTDERLTFTSASNISRLELDLSSMQKIWLPDSYFVNEKSAELHDITVPNKLLHIFPNGSVLYSIRVSGTFAAYLNLKKFPLDHQQFNLEITSYGYSNKTLLFRWKEPPVLLSPRLDVAQFELSSTSVYTCDSTYLIDVNFTCIGLILHLDRMYGYYIIQIYIPSILIVLVSWVSFWLAADATPARVSLGITTVLTLTAQFSGTRTSLARVSYIKGIDVWMAVCLIFVFLAVLEFALVNLVSRTEVGFTNHCLSNDNGRKFEENGKEQNHDKIQTQKEREDEAMVLRKRLVIGIDKMSRVLFPCFFLLFNVIYWSIYAT